MPKINNANRFEKLLQKYHKQLKYADAGVRVVGVVVIGLIALEFFSFLGTAAYRNYVSIRNDGIPDPRYNKDVFKGVGWAKEYFKEYNKSAKSEYAPFVGYKRVPNFEGSYVNINAESLRKTHYQCPSKEKRTYKIFVFGGSTVWGMGARDKATIPSFLAKELCDKGFNVEVTNFAETGYTNSQEMIRLILELREKNEPDIAVFYDGANDVWSSFQNKKAGVPQNIQNREKEFNSRKEANLEGLFSNFYLVVGKVLRVISKGHLSQDSNEYLITKTADVYLSNLEVINGLGENYGYEAFFFWQPVIYSRQNVTASEKKEVDFVEQMEEDYVKTTAKVLESESVIDMTGIFDTYSETFYIDWAHVSEDGNLIVAKEIAQIVESYLLEETSNAKK